MAKRRAYDHQKTIDKRKAANRDWILRAAFKTYMNVGQVHVDSAIADVVRALNVFVGALVKIKGDENKRAVYVLDEVFDGGSRSRVIRARLDNVEKNRDGTWSRIHNDHDMREHFAVHVNVTDLKFFGVAELRED